GAGGGGRRGRAKARCRLRGGRRSRRYRFPEGLGRIPPKAPGASQEGPGLVSNTRQQPPQNLIAAPSLKAPAAGLLDRRSPTAPCSKGLEAEGHGVRLAPSRPSHTPSGARTFGGAGGLGNHS